MRKVFGIFILICLTFFSCEKKSLDEQLYKEVFPDRSTHNLNKIEKLIQSGADVNYKNMIADIVQYIPDSYTEVLKLLIQHGADINYYLDKEDNKYQFEGYNLASFNKRYLVNNCSTSANLELILANGAPVEIDCGNGITPLLTVLEYNYRAVVDLLIKYGAKIRTDNVTITVGVTPGNPYAEHLTDTSVTVNHSEVNLLALCGYSDILQNFLENSKYNPNKKDPDGLDLFCYAVIGNDYETVKMLMKYCNTINKKQYNVKDYEGNNHYYTLYGIADYSDCEESKRALVECGADGSK